MADLPGGSAVRKELTRDSLQNDSFRLNWISREEPALVITPKVWLL
jgi:hypothetical protein